MFLVPLLPVTLSFRRGTRSSEVVPPGVLRAPPQDSRSLLDSKAAAVAEDRRPEFHLGQILGNQLFGRRSTEGIAGDDVERLRASEISLHRETASGRRIAYVD